MSNSILHPLYPQPQSGGVSQSLTVSTAAVAATGYNLASPNAVQLVTFDVQTSDLRARWDGTDPTSTVGHVIPAGTAYTWAASQYNATKWIRDSTATADGVVFASPFNGG